HRDLGDPGRVCRRVGRAGISVGARGRVRDHGGAVAGGRRRPDRLRDRVSAEDEAVIAMRKTLFTIGLLAAPRAALACPVCFGNSDSPLAIATNMGIIAMLVIVAGMIGAFATFFIYLNRRAKRVAAQERTA